jgi:hypothetical protein
VAAASGGDVEHVSGGAAGGSVLVRLGVGCVRADARSRQQGRRAWQRSTREKDLGVGDVLGDLMARGGGRKGRARVSRILQRRVL